MKTSAEFVLEAVVMPNLRLAERPREKASIRDSAGVQAVFAFGRAWSRAVAGETKPAKPIRLRAVRRS